MKPSTHTFNIIRDTISPDTPEKPESILTIQNASVKQKAFDLIQDQRLTVHSFEDRMINPVLVNQSKAVIDMVLSTNVHFLLPRPGFSVIVAVSMIQQSL